MKVHLAMVLDDFLAVAIQRHFLNQFLSMHGHSTNLSDKSSFNVIVTVSPVTSFCSSLANLTLYLVP